MRLHKKSIRLLAFLTLFITMLSIGSYNVSADASYWAALGNAGFSAGVTEYPSIAVVGNTPYVAYRDGNTGLATVMKFDGLNWVDVGNWSLSGCYSGTGVEIAIGSGGIPYIFYSDDDYFGKATVKRLEGDTWIDVGSGGFSSSSVTELSMDIDSNGTPYVAYKENDNGYVKRFNGTSWDTVGGTYFAAGGTDYIDIALDAGNNPYVVYSDWSVPTEPKGRVAVRKFDGASWGGKLGGEIGSGQSSYNCIEIVNGVPIIAYKDAANTRAMVRIFNGSTWEAEGSGAISPGYANYTDMVLDNTTTPATPYVVFLDSTVEYRATVKKLDGTSWVTVGNPGLTAAQADYLSIAMGTGGKPYIAFKDTGSSYKATVYQGFIRHSLTYTPSGHGSIQGTAAQTVNHGAAGTAVTAVPETYYYFDKWSDNSTVNPRTDINVQKDIAVSAVFIANTVVSANLNNVPAAQAVNEDQQLVFSTANGNAISILNPGVDPAELMKVSLTATNGRITLSRTTGLAFSVGGGAGVASMAFTGTLTNINGALNGLSFSPQANYNGNAAISVQTDDQGNSQVGITNTDADTVQITVNAANDAPTFTKGADKTVIEDSGAQTFAGWATGIGAGPSDESGQTCLFTVANDNNSLFSVQPAVAANGTLTFTPAADAYGSATVTVSVHDNGGTSNGGVDASASQTFIITISPVNEAPSFTKGSDKTELEDSGAQSFAGWATGISTGPANESGQTCSFTVTNDNNGLFSAQPAVAANGTLTYTPAANANGSATVTVSVHDDGGTSNGGVDASASQTFTITVNSVNDAPTFTKGADKTVLEDSGAQSFAGWATGIGAGPADESGQSYAFTVTNDNNSLFSVQPAVAANGTLTYTPAANVNGSATVTVSLHDDGGTSNGGVDASAAQTFIITVSPVNEAPSFTKGADKTELEDSGAQSFAGWATGISAGPANESGQACSFTVTNDNNGLFSAQPAVAANGTLTYTPAANANGSATVTVSVHDDGGTSNGGADASASQTFTITVTSVNDAPTFTKGADKTVLEDSGVQTFAGWATGIGAGPADESGQSYAFTVTNDNNSLFSVQPAVAANGTLTYTPAANVNGSATVTVSLHDDGGTSNGGVDASAAQTFIITVSPVNEAPSFTKGADKTVLEDSGAQSFAGWATGISTGSANESGQALSFTISNDNSGLFLAQPAVAEDGTLTFTPAANANGSATVTVSVHDNGGTANGGVDTSASQTFTITVTSVNDSPTFTKGADQTVNEDSGAQTTAGWATGIGAGPADESAQTLTFNVTNNNNGLFSVQPSVALDGTLTYTPADDANGSATVTITLQDNGGGADTSASQTFIITINTVNDGSSFTKGADQTVNEDSGVQTVDGWATGITAGPPNESGQTLEFIVNNDNNGLFSMQPAVEADGTLTYTPAADANGNATVTVILTDNGGVDTTAPQTFTINVSIVNDTPSFTKGADQSISEDSGSQTIEDWATGITAGPPNESGQALTFNVTNDNNSLFSVQPSVALDGTLTYTPVADANGSATVTITLQDNGGGADTSAIQTFVITLSSINDTPSFTEGADQTVNEGCGAQTVAGWATAITAGPANESSQTLEFNVTNDNNALFSVQPAVLSNGTLTYTVADNTSGIATVSVRLKDNGGGMDTSNAQTFVIKVCAQSGSGGITLSQDTFTAGKTGSTITFTYTAASGGMEDGKLAIEVPDGWSNPSTVSAANGYTTAGTGIVSISGRTLIISNITVGSGDTISVTYGDKSGGGAGATASTVKGLYEWKVKSAAMADSTLSSLVSSPKIRILPDTTSATQSSTLAGNNDIPADGLTTTTITVVLADAYGNAIGDHNVSLSQGSGASTIVPSSAVTDNDGKAVFTVSSFSAGKVTYTAKDNTDSITLSEKAEVNFKPGIKYTKAAVNIEEGGAAEYSVSLISCPTSEVTVTAAVYEELDVSPVELIFDAGNWNIDQIFSLTAEDNSSKDGDRMQTVTNSVYSSDLQYDGLDFDITVNILDNDTPGVSIIQSGGDTGVEEAGTEDSYTVKLFTKPKGDVAVSVHTDNQLTVEPAELIFTSSNWNTAQSFTVRAFDDHLIEGVHSSTISHTVSSSDNDYDGIDISDITVGIADNDFPEDPSDDSSLKSLVISHGTLTPGFDPAVTKYNVSVANNIGSIAITPTVTESHGSITVNGIAVASGTASHTITLSVGKNTINVQVTAQDGVTKKTYVIEVVRASNQNDDDNDGPPSGGGGNAGGSVIPKENLPVQQPNKGSDGKISITVSTKLDSNGTAAASLDAAALANAFGLAEAGADGVRTVILDIPGVEGANAYDCKLPASYLSSGDSNRSVEIKTDIASVTVPGNMLLRESPEGSQSISLIIASADKNRIEEDIQAKIGDRPVIELYLMIDGKKIPWSNKNAPVTVAIPYTPTAEELKDPEHITVWYIDSAGNTVSVPSGRYDPATGKVTFSTTHFSQYAVVYVGKTFSDMGSYSWARKQIEVLASKGIINGISEKAFSPQVNISRGDYLVLLVKTLGLTTDFDSNFVDVKPDDYYYEAAGIARKLGIATGDKENRFDPRTDICRQDMMVLTARALEISGKLKPVQETSAILDKYSDKGGLAVYAVESAATLVSEKLITGSDGRLNPVGHTTRAEAAVLLYRIYNMYND